MNSIGLWGLRSMAIAALSAMVACSSAPADEGDAASASESALATTPPNFLEVRDGLYRGGHPDASALDHLKALGVKRIVNLEVGDFIEAFPWDISRELEEASDRGMTEIRYPMSAFEPAVSGRFDTNMDEVLAILATATPADPIYVHCKHGQDRTGLVIGLERVNGEGWTPANAHAEMVTLGFHTSFIGLDEYFDRKTGWED